MKQLLPKVLRYSITLALAVVAVWLGHLLWVRYMDSPWTRDGRVRADVVNIAPDVAGLVTQVVVHDNQLVHRGDVLFRIDQEHYRTAVAQAKALVSSESHAGMKRDQQSDVQRWMTRSFRVKTVKTATSSHPVPKPNTKRHWPNWIRPG